MTVRERIELQENQFLSPYAARAAESKRDRKESPCNVRTNFQQDRDRILHCNAFKRLRHKTQVFLSPNHDHYRTRLIHTLEVAQIARTIARGLQLNEDLTEAIALGHDLGHTPFGHAGEAVLNQICPHSFQHAANSVRVVEYLEKDGRGLNLTWETRDGIRCHSNLNATTLEGRIVKISDKVAYVNHDIEDAIRAGVLQPEQLPKDCIAVLGETKSQRITTIVESLIQNSREAIRMERSIWEAHQALRKFMFDNVYYAVPSKKLQEEKAKNIVSQMYRYYLEHERKLPEFYQETARKFDIHQAVCDYISGMTDTYIVEKYTDIFIPKSWNI